MITRQMNNPRHQVPGPPELPQDADMLKGRNSFRQFVPGLIVLVMAVILVAVGILISTSIPSTSSNLTAAKDTYETNNTGTEYSTQQTVVNGWYTNDLLIVLDKEMRDSNKKLSFTIWISVALLLVAFGAYFILSKRLQRD